MEDHKSYELVINRPCDFIVKYRFIQKGSDGNIFVPFQGYRTDFMYEEDESKNEQWIIWPEFLDSNGDIIKSKLLSVEIEGKALMWIVNDEFIEMHRQRIKIRQKGFFMRGRHKLAECEVIEIVRLRDL